VQRVSEVRSIFKRVIPQPKITYDSVSGDLLDEIKAIIDETILLIKEEDNEKV
jgi:hypothetical protein